MKTETTHRADELHLLRDSRAARPASGERVEALMDRDFVSLPSWFTAAQAAQVLRQTGKSYALFDGQRLATVAELQAGGARAAGSCATCLGPAIALDASSDHAWAMMEQRRLDRLAVVLGRALVGILTRESLEGRLPARRDARLAA